MTLMHVTARGSRSLGAYWRKAVNATSTERNNSIDAIKQAARRAGDAAQEWRSGGSSRGSTAMRQAAASSHSVYDSTKRAVEHGAAVGGQEAMSNRSVEDLEATEAKKREALAAVCHSKDG
ncbi:hypothetical protein N2152v2_008437 [Parachlorella kessleri]